MKKSILFYAALSSASVLFAADWITGAYEPPAETNTAAFFAPAPNPVVKKSFCTRGPVARAIWRVAAPGLRDLFVNGTRVTSTALPPWTPYKHRVLEESFDVTRFLKPKTANTLVAELGNGWYNPLPLTMWYHYSLRAVLEIGTPCIRATLDVVYADGTREAVPTDASWQAFEGKIIHNNLYLGVVEDARRTEKAVGAARVVKGPRGKVCPAGNFPKVVVYNRRRAQSVKQLPSGAWLVDFGVNATGTLRVKLHHVREGQKISFRQGERLFPDGTLNALTAVAGQIKRPERGPLFGVAEERDTIICRAAKELVFEPRLTFHVYRYVQVEGLETAPTAADFESLDWSADVREAGSFACSDARLNKLHEICRRTFRSNLQSVQSDCPGREKFGYDGDVSCTAESFFCNYAMGDFYRKAVRDYLDEASEDGLFTETAPFVGIASRPAVPGPAANEANGMTAAKGTRAGPIGWATGVPVLLDAVVRYAGDLDLLKEAYPALVRYLGILDARYPDGRVPPCLGDWIALRKEKANESLTGNAHYHQFARLTAKFARLLGRADDAARFDALAGKIAAAWRADFCKGEGLVGRGVQGEQIFALYHGLLDEAEAKKALALLKKDIAARGDSFTVGIFGLQYLLEWLSLNGEGELAGRLVTHEGFPGWFDLMARGATTLWESFDEKECVNSYSNCHPMFGSCEQWFTRHVLGIQVCDDAVGCDRVRIRPQALAGLTWAKGHLDTPKGRIEISWKLVNGKMQVEKKVPTGICIVE